MTECLLTEIRDHVGIISLNRPDRHNALNDDLAERFSATFRDFSEREAVRCILIRGEGKSFCSGRDVAELGHRARDESDFLFVRRHQADRLAQLDCPKPVVAALKGAVLGGGCEIALAADIRVASTDLKMGLPEINYGLLPDTGGTQLFNALIGPARTKYLVMTGARLDAETALAWGAVEFIAPPEAHDQKAFEIAREIAAKPPLALAMAKQMIDQLHLPGVRNGIGQELLAQTALFLTEDYKEARAAIREKRTPDYKGH